MQAEAQRVVGFRFDGAQVIHGRRCGARGDGDLLDRPLQFRHIGKIGIVASGELRTQEQGQRAADVVQIARPRRKGGLVVTGQPREIGLADQLFDHREHQRQGLAEADLQVVAVDVDPGRRRDAVGHDMARNACIVAIEQRRAEALPAAECRYPIRSASARGR